MKKKLNILIMFLIGIVWLAAIFTVEIFVHDSYTYYQLTPDEMSRVD